MKTVPCFLFILAIVIFTSCQKEIDTNILATPQNDSIYLDKAIGMDTTLPAGTDTTDKIFFTYDNSKRVKTMTQLYGTGFTVSSTFDFLYNGNDSLPWKLIDREIFSGVYDQTDTVYYSYFNAVVSRDSTISWDNISGLNVGAIVTSYTVAGNTVNRTVKQYDFVGGNYVLISTDPGTVNVTSSSGNILTQNLVSGSNTFQSVQASYDTKPNPISRTLKIRYPEFDTPLWLGWAVQNNNPVQVQYQEVGSPVQTEMYSYLYRSDGYPLRFTFSSTAGNSLANKIFFFYKSL